MNLDEDDESIQRYFETWVGDIPDDKVIGVMYLLLKPV